MHAKEYLLLTNDIRITRDFTKQIIAKDQRKSTKVFFIATGLTKPDFSQEQNARLIELVSDTVKSKGASIVDSREIANHRIQVLLDLHSEYAIRNPAGQAAHGSVTVSFCKYPIASAVNDCENLTYHFFSDLKVEEMLNTALTKWSESVFPQ